MLVKNLYVFLVKLLEIIRKHKDKYEDSPEISCWEILIIKVLHSSLKSLFLGVCIVLYSSDCGQDST